MSSIKCVCQLSSLRSFTYQLRQVQDLQSQIAELTQQNSHLRTRATDHRSADLDPRPVQTYQFQHKPSTPIRIMRVSAPILTNFEHVRKNVRTHSQGVFNPPLCGQARPPVDLVQDSVEIPPKSEFTSYSQSYYNTIHKEYPVIAWALYQAEAEQVYSVRSFQGASRGWIGVFFAIMACGHLNSQCIKDLMREGRRALDFYETASQMMTPWPQELTIEHTQLLLLLSIFATESNMKSAGSMWLSCAIRAAQTLGLNLDIGDNNVLFPDRELRCRLWWAIYVRERLVSLYYDFRLHADPL
jgi:hypothetical protein